MNPILQVDSLSGGYLPGKPVLRDLHFTVGQGEMLGLIGLNGAGKSTTIKHILGLLTPQKGSIRIRGRALDEEPLAYRAAYAYVPESPELYDELTIGEHLELTALAYGLPKDVYQTRTGTLLRQFQMEDKLGSFAAHLSKGMKQKVMIMNAFLVEPALYIIDEPFLGLDPLAIRSLLELMVQMKRRGASFLICSHVLSTIERYCDRYLVLHKGVTAASGTLDELRRQANAPEATLDDLFYRLVAGDRP
ncbi:ABC transporter ATP-binding protein [Paenibacillus athensensis]|uniref:Multidrug ABC transporter ATP-binding protein n=1 Tax=Paenibacillus athensensis TaxID=1967502 RepID=A0A4Y8PVQ2_9BACL|nr:ABC transporter ATP-binding protein [Paenibacillus athensensis]MCD1261902.1 ABC transporter ATP-binding protein [Paenibacillus athensensis]